MTQTPPIACTLSPDEMPQRAAGIRALSREALLTVERSEARVTLRFRRDPAIRVRVEGITDAESKCCAFIDFELSEAADAMVLTLRTLDEGKAAMHMLADLFAAAGPETAAS